MNIWNVRSKKTVDKITNFNISIASRIYLFGVLCVLLYFLISYRFAFNYEDYLHQQYRMIIIIPLLLLPPITVMVDKKSDKSHSKSLFVWCLVVPVLLLTLTYSQYYSFASEYCCVVLLCMFLASGVYFLIDKCTVEILFFSILLFFCYEVYIGTIQWIEGHTYADNPLYLQGTLQNSGVYGFYLVVHLPLLVWSVQMVLKVNMDWLRISGIALLVLLYVQTLFLIYQTQSRTAVIVFVVLLFGYILYFRGKIKSDFLRRLPLTIVIGAFVVMLFGFGYIGNRLFLVRKGSTMGRWMRMDIALRHIRDHFWFGTGLGRFSWYFPQWQAQYFRERPIPPIDYVLSSGESYILFNEYVQLFETVGLVGTVLLLILQVRFFRLKTKRKIELLFMLKMSVLAILACGFTSYPLHVNYMLIVLLLCITCGFGISESNTEDKKIINNVRFPNLLKCGYFIPFTLVVLLVSVKSLILWKADDKWSKDTEMVLERQERINKFSSLYPIFHRDGKFLTDYGKVLLLDTSNARRAKDVLDEANRYNWTLSLLQARAGNFLLRGDTLNAIKTYNSICNFMPYKFQPKTELLELYKVSRDTSSAISMARQIIRCPVKIPSQEVDDYKKMAYQTTKEYKRNR